MCFFSARRNPDARQQKTEIASLQRRAPVGSERNWKQADNKSPTYIQQLPCSSKPDKKVSFPRYGLILSTFSAWREKRVNTTEVTVFVGDEFDGDVVEGRCRNGKVGEETGRRERSRRWMA